MKRQFVIALSLVGMMMSCSKSDETGDDEPAGACASVTSTFAANVSPLISSTCTDASCHGTGSTNGPGPLLTYNQIFAARANIRSAVSSGIMPKNSSLSQANKNLIICWIDSGAANN